MTLRYFYCRVIVWSILLLNSKFCFYMIKVVLIVVIVASDASNKNNKDICGKSKILPGFKKVTSQKHKLSLYIEEFQHTNGNMLLLP